MLARFVFLLPRLWIRIIKILSDLLHRILTWIQYPFLFIEPWWHKLDSFVRLQLQPFSRTYKREYVSLTTAAVLQIFLCTSTWQVSKPRSVKAEKLMNIERFSHVMHISSTVRLFSCCLNSGSYDIHFIMWQFRLSSFRYSLITFDGLKLGMFVALLLFPLVFRAKLLIETNILFC